MKQIYQIIIIGFLIASCQSNVEKYYIVKRKKIVTENNCNLPIEYPEIKGLEQKKKLKNLNQVLENFPEHEYYANICDVNTTNS